MKSPKKPHASPVTALLQAVWDHAQGGRRGHSREVLNHAMRAALELAIGAGFEFEAADFKSLERFRHGHWLGESAEWCYSLAVAEANQSAAEAYEAWRGRVPIIADGVRVGRHRFAHMAGTRQRERLHVGAEFKWLGEQVTVTGFSDEGHAVACSYRDGERRKVKRVYRITRDAVIAARADAKERAALAKRLVEYTATGPVPGLKPSEILALLGVKTQAEYDRLPVKKIRRIAAKLAAVAATAKEKP